MKYIIFILLMTLNGVQDHKSHNLQSKIHSVQSKIHEVNHKIDQISILVDSLKTDI